MASTTHHNATEGNAMNTYQISHYDYAQGKRVIDGHVSATDIYAAKYGYWIMHIDGPMNRLVSRPNELHICGGNKYTFTKIGEVA